MTGFYMWYKNKDLFFESERKNKTENLAREILNIINQPATSENIKAVIYRLLPAKCEIKECSHGKYYEIHGENFGGRGSFIDDGKTEIFKLTA